MAGWDVVGLRGIDYAKLLADIKVSARALQNRAVMAVITEKAKVVANCDQVDEVR